MIEPLFFTTSKSVIILLSLTKGKQPKYCTQISREIDITNAYMMKCIGDLKKNKLIQATKRGRNHYLTLTKKGAEITEKIYEIDKLIKELK